jgi:Flp pilus assembly pilin Flp
LFKFIEELKAKLQEKISEKGQGMTEYAIILAVVAVVAVAVFMGEGGKGGTLGNAITGAYNKAGDAINNIEVTPSSTTTTP